MRRWGVGIWVVPDGHFRAIDTKCGVCDVECTEEEDRAEELYPSPFPLAMGIREKRGNDVETQQRTIAL